MQGNDEDPVFLSATLAVAITAFSVLAPPQQIAHVIGASGNIRVRVNEHEPIEMIFMADRLARNVRGSY